MSRKIRAQSNFKNVMNADLEDIGPSSKSQKDNTPIQTSRKIDALEKTPPPRTIFEQTPAKKSPQNKLKIPDYNTQQE